MTVGIEPEVNQETMARYQILYWEHIPIGVKATDVNGTVRENLPARFQEAVERASMRAGQTSAAAYTSMFKWGPEHEREGSAREVASAVVRELDETWNEEEALALYERGELDF
ncbi:MAG: hypothetical protein D6784_10920 [Chloroflexi bacterium]|nr:MAG: hypothetical protein D6784_10920 [Chloroflexota bacterium]